MRRPTKSPFHRPAMQTLERLHAELGGQILENKEEAQRLAGQMLHVEAVIKMLDPTYNLRRIAVKRRKSNPWSSEARSTDAPWTCSGRQQSRRRAAARAVSARGDCGAGLGSRQYNWLAI